MNMRQARKHARTTAAVLLFDALGSEVVSDDDTLSPEDKIRVQNALCDLVLQIDPECQYDVEMFRPDGTFAR